MHQWCIPTMSIYECQIVQSAFLSLHNLLIKVVQYNKTNTNDNRNRWCQLLLAHSWLFHTTLSRKGEYDLSRLGVMSQRPRPKVWMIPGNTLAYLGIPLRFVATLIHIVRMEKGWRDPGGANQQEPWWYSQVIKWPMTRLYIMCWQHGSVRNIYKRSCKLQ